MAKDYLSIEQACEALGMSEDQVNNLAKEGRLHAIRDAGKLFFKKDEISEMAKKEGSSVVNLQATDEDSPADLDLDDSSTFASALSSLADSSATLGAIDESPVAESPPPLEPTADGSGSSSVFSLEEEDASDAQIADAEPAELSVEDVPENLPAAPAASSADQPQEPTPELSSEIDLLPAGEDGSSTNLADVSPVAPADLLEDIPDLGLSGSSIISLEPGGDSSMTDSPAAKEDTKLSKIGISVFDEDELEVETDPMGETRISAGTEDFDAVGSGSGLLDLTQESDDTSLGAELLDVISPSDAAETETDSGIIEAETLTEDTSAEVIVPQEAQIETAPTLPTVAARQVATEVMAGSVPMNICLFLGMLALAVMGLATAAVYQGVWPEKILGIISSGVVHYSVFGGLVLVALVTGILSILAGRGR